MNGTRLRIALVADSKIMNKKLNPVPLKNLTEKKAAKKVATEVMKDAISEIQDSELLIRASSLAYITLLSIVPFLAVSFSIFHAFQGLDQLYLLVQPLILSHLTESAGEEAMKTLLSLISNIHAKALGMGGLVALIFTSMAMLSNIEKAINRIWRVKITRSFFQRVTAYWFFVTLGPLAISVAFGLISSNQLSFVNVFPTGFWGFLLTALFFFGIYKWVPNQKVHWVPSLLGGLFTASMWNLARWGYAIYIKNFVSYDKIYGSLGAIPIFILWIYIIWIVILTGATLSYSIQKRISIK